MRQKIDNLLELEPLCEEINEVKDLLFFKILFDNTLGENEKICFTNAKNYLERLK